MALGNALLKAGCRRYLGVCSTISEPELSPWALGSSAMAFDPNCPGAVTVNIPTVPGPLCPELSDSESVAELPVDGSVIVDVFPKQRFLGTPTQSSLELLQSMATSLTADNL